MTAGKSMPAAENAWHDLPAAEVNRRIHTDPERGLSGAGAADLSCVTAPTRWLIHQLAAGYWSVLQAVLRTVPLTGRSFWSSPSARWRRSR